MYAQREKPKENKKQVTVVVNQTKTSPKLGEDCLAHLPNGLGQRHHKAQIRNAAARYCQPSPSTIQRMDDDKDKDKKQTSENLNNLQLSLELLGMTPGVGMIADAANVGISLFRGNYADALINLAAMVPIVGQGVTGGKLATKAASSATDVLGATKAKTANNLVDDVTKTGENLETASDTIKGLAIPKDLPDHIHLGQQGKHILGHNNFTPGRSPLAEGINPQELLDEVKNGIHTIIRITPRGQPVVNFGKNIGQFEGKTTQYGIIHYGKNGAHIVPANPIQF